MLAIYLSVGALVGIMSGMLGIGGGILIIPALTAIFSYLKIFPESSIMHMAIGTSLSIVILTTSSGLYSYHRRGSVQWNLVRAIIPSILIGVLIGAVIANFLSSHFLQLLFGVFLFLVSLKFLFEKSKKEIGNPLSKSLMRFFSVIIGVLCSLLGLGGGVLLMPFLMHCQIDIRNAAGTSLACGMMVGIVATTIFLFSPNTETQIVPWTTGYIYWPAFAGIALASILFAPVGTFFAHKLPTAILKKIFAVFLMIIAIEMLYKAILS
jgi:uncharacterized membrane protein YfcA